MRKVLIKALSLLCVSVLLLALCACGQTDVSHGQEGNVTVLFTHDLHSHFLPADDGNDGQYGGFARLKAAIDAQKSRYPDAILVDGGDFSMGSLFQTAFTTDALELRMMGALGYDATTLGNHEFDYLPAGLASMLNAAVDSGETLPALLVGNYFPAKEGESGYDAEDAALWAAFEEYGVADYRIFERGGVYFAIFGLMGEDSDSCAPNSGCSLLDPVQTAQKIVDAAIADCVSRYGVEPFVVCLSHSGTENGKGEDYDLAKNVAGIDLIISGHTHTTLEETIRVGETYIVSAGEYGKNLGVVQLQFADGKAQLVDYELIPIDQQIQEDTHIAELIQQHKETINEQYLAPYGFDFDLPLVYNPYTFDTVRQVYATQHESTLGNVYSDAYHWAAENLGGLKVDVTLTACGVIRETLHTGVVTVSDVFNAASLGVGTEGELIAVYITGKDLKNALEVDASIQPIMPGAQLFFSGVEYSFNTYRMIFNKVDRAMLRMDGGTTEMIDDDKLYCVVTGMYVGQMLGNVEESSFGILAITPRDANGEPIAVEDLSNYVIRLKDGRPLKEWFAISVYLANMQGNMDTRYADTDGRKVVYHSLNPVKLLKNANFFTYIAVSILMIVCFATCMAVLIVHKKRKHKET